MYSNHESPADLVDLQVILQDTGTVDADALGASKSIDRHPTLLDRNGAAYQQTYYGIGLVASFDAATVAAGDKQALVLTLEHSANNSTWSDVNFLETFGDCTNLDGFDTAANTIRLEATVATGHNPSALLTAKANIPAGRLQRYVRVKAATADFDAGTSNVVLAALLGGRVHVKDYSFISLKD